MKNKTILFLLVVMCLMLFAGCETEPQTLYESDSVQVVREGNRTTVYDLLTADEYNFRSVRVRRSESVSEPLTTIDTDTIRIDIIPSGLRVYDKTANKIFTYQRKSLHNKG